MRSGCADALAARSHDAVPPKVRYEAAFRAENRSYVAFVSYKRCNVCFRPSIAKNELNLRMGRWSQGVRNLRNIGLRVLHANDDRESNRGHRGDLTAADLPY